MSEQFVRNGFLVEKPPELNERFWTDWNDKFSLPVKHEDGTYTCKPVVYYDPEEGKWGLRFAGVYNSEFLKIFETPGSASEYARQVLRAKK